MAAFLLSTKQNDIPRRAKEHDFIAAKHKQKQESQSETTVFIWGRQGGFSLLCGLLQLKPCSVFLSFCLAANF
jgi:hypothetical protein